MCGFNRLNSAFYSLLVLVFILSPTVFGLEATSSPNDCSPGYVWQLSTESCAPCPPGSFQAGPTCQLCSPGTAQPLSAQTTCNPCTGLDYASEMGSVTCLTCRAHLLPAAAVVPPLGCAYCPLYPPSYHDPGGGGCRACTDIGDNDFCQLLDDDPLALYVLRPCTEPGHYRRDETTCWECPPDYACAGGAEPPVWHFIWTLDVSTVSGITLAVVAGILGVGLCGSLAVNVAVQRQLRLTHKRQEYEDIPGPNEDYSYEDYSYE